MSNKTLLQLADRVQSLLTDWGDMEMREERDAIATQLRTAAAEGGEAVGFTSDAALRTLAAEHASGVMFGTYSERYERTVPLYLHPPTDSGAGRDGWLPTVDWLSTKLCEARNHWCEHHEDDWLITDENNPDEWIANFLIHALATDRNAVVQWHPIETAPRDGTLILGWFDNPRWPSAPGILQWTEHNGGGWTHYANGTPTHWQRIKPPPKDTAIAGAAGE